MFVKIKLKPVTDVFSFFLTAFFWLPVYIAVNILYVAIPLWIAWNGVHSYWPEVKPIDFELAVRFGFGVNLVLEVIEKIMGFAYKQKELS